MSLFPTPRQRLELGRSHRKQMRRADHAACPIKNRRADPIDLLKASMRGRVPALVPLKYQLMAESPFGFFRGAVPVMAYDLSLTPNSGVQTQLCGDAHVRNLGAFAAPDGKLVFDINDFDETICGPFEWDLKRMATSILLAARSLGGRDSASTEAMMTFLAHYRTTMLRFTRMGLLDVARYQVHRLNSVTPLSSIFRIAERATPLHSLETLTKPAGPRTSHLEQLPAPLRIFRNDPPSLRRLCEADAQHVLHSLKEYAATLLPERRHLLAQYTPVDIAFKVVGTGSVGLRDYCIFFRGNGPTDPLFLQIKEEPGSAYAPYLAAPSNIEHQGRRVAEGQRAMQLQSDPFLGWTTIEGRDYVVRQLNDHKASLKIATLKPQALVEYAKVCGELLARGHARPGDPATLAGYIGRSPRFDEAVARFATTYAEQTEKDWDKLRRWLKSHPSPTSAKAAAKRVAAKAGLRAT